MTRGAQGNALKTIIAICFQHDCLIHFVTGGKQITYTPDKLAISLGQLAGAFTKTTAPTTKANGVYVEAGIPLVMLLEYLVAYQLVNAGVQYTVNGDTYQPLTAPRKVAAVYSIHWYNLAAFSDLVRRTAINYPGNPLLAKLISMSTLIVCNPKLATEGTLISINFILK